MTSRRDSAARDQDAVTRSRLAAIVTSSADAIIGETLDGIITDWNPAAERLYGYTAAEAIGQHLSLLAPANLADEPRHLLARVRAGESVAGIETVRRTKDGRRIAVSLTVSPVRNEAGQIVAASGISRDITERKAAEAELAATHQRTRDGLERISDGFYALDREWRFTYLNEAAERITGRRREELLGRNVWEEFAPAVETPLFPAFHRAMAEGLPITLDYYYAPRDRWMEVRAYPSPDGLSVFFHDVSERVRAEAALRESEVRRSALLAALPDMVFRIDQDGTILDYKADRLADLAAPPEAFLGHPVGETLPADVAAAIEAAIRRVLDASSIETVEYALELPGGLRDFEARLVSAGPTEAVAVVREVTERKQRDEELRAALHAAQSANRAKTLFLRMMSHELRTPMQAVLGYADLLLSGGSGSLTREQVEDVQTIRRGAERMMALVSRMLDLSRLEAGRMELTSGLVDLGAILAQVRDDVAPQATTKGLALHIELPAELPPVWGDAMGIHQILLNLAGNAVKFTQAGSVCITARTTGDAVAVAVSDTGIGIPVEALPSIFEEFHQIDGGMARRHEGAGLGLAIAKMLAEQMGGRINVESCPAVGSTFTLHLPLCGETVSTQNEG